MSVIGFMIGMAQYPLGTVIAETGLDSPAPEEIAYFYPAEKGAGTDLWVKPAGQYVRIFHRGYYGNITNTLKIASDYLNQNGLTICGPIYEYDCVTYLIEAVEDSVQMLLIIVMIPVTVIGNHRLNLQQVTVYLFRNLLRNLFGCSIDRKE